MSIRLQLSGSNRAVPYWITHNNIVLIWKLDKSVIMISYQDHVFIFPSAQRDEPRDLWEREPRVSIHLQFSAYLNLQQSTVLLVVEK